MGGKENEHHAYSGRYRTLGAGNMAFDMCEELHGEVTLPWNIGYPGIHIDHAGMPFKKSFCFYVHRCGHGSAGGMGYISAPCDGKRIHGKGSKEWKRLMLWE